MARVRDLLRGKVGSHAILVVLALLATSTGIVLAQSGGGIGQSTNASSGATQSPRIVDKKLGEEEEIRIRGEWFNAYRRPGTTADSEMAAVRQAFAWAEAGDLLVLLLHAERKDALAFLKELQESGWTAGQALG